MSNLNIRQQQAVDCDENTILLAVPGSGKSKVVVSKVLKLVNRGVTNITIATFTRAAANELINKLKSEMNQELSTIKVGTFHSLLIDHMSNYSDLLMVSVDEQVNVLHQLYFRKFGEHSGFEEFMEYFNAQLSGTTSKPNEEYEEIIRQYYNESRKSIDQTYYSLNDLIITAQTLIEQGKLPLLPTDWLLVDEFQDVDSVQLNLILTHSLCDIKLLLVGDCDQSIYKFRQALGYQAFVKASKFLNVKPKNLTTNYRSHEEIIDASQMLIRHNNHRIEKDIDSSLGPGGYIFSYLFSTDYYEHQFIARWLSKNSHLNDIGIIARSNGLLDKLEFALNEHNVKYTRYKPNSQFCPAEHVFMSLLESLCKRNELGIIAAIEPLVSNSIQAELITKSLLNDTTLDMNLPDNCSAVFQTLKASMKYFIHQKETKALNLISRFLIGRLNELGFATTYKIQNMCSRLTSLKGNVLYRLNILTRKNNVDHPVKLLTGHSSKGLQFEMVFLIGLSKDVFPSKKCDDLEEERRLCYVCMTRAIKYLLMFSSTGTEKRPHSLGVSRFIYESGVDTKQVHTGEDSSDFYEFQNTLDCRV